MRIGLLYNYCNRVRESEFEETCHVSRSRTRRRASRDRPRTRDSRASDVVASTRSAPRRSDARSAATRRRRRRARRCGDDDEIDDEIIFASSPPRARDGDRARARCALRVVRPDRARAEQLLRARGAPDAAGGARTTLSTPRASPPVAPRRLRRPRANGPISPAPGADGADAPPPPPPTRRRAAQISWLYPPKGHIIGGTVVTIYGSGFKRSATGKVREPRRESTSSSRGPSHPPSRS